MSETLKSWTFYCDQDGVWEWDSTARDWFKTSSEDGEND